MTTTIYALIDSRSGDVRYVGKTRNAERRLFQHRNYPLKSLESWVAELQELGLAPDLRVLEIVDDGFATVAEAFWFRYMNALTNEGLLNRVRPCSGQQPGWKSSATDHEAAEKFCSEFHQAKALEVVLNNYGLTLDDLKVRESITERVNRYFADFSDSVRQDMAEIAWDEFVAKRRQERLTARQVN